MLMGFSMSVRALACQSAEEFEGLPLERNTINFNAFELHDVAYK